MPSCLAVEERRSYDANTEAVGSTREQQAMEELKQALGWTPATTTAAASEVFLFRCLKSVHFSVTEAVTLLKQRRSFEERLTCIRMTAPVLTLLRSGIFSIIGRDVLGRTVLYISTQHFTQAVPDVQDTQRLVIVVMEYLLMYCMQISVTTAPTGVKRGDILPSHRRQEQGQVIVLVNEEKSSWHANQSAISHMSMICSLLSKYYPRLIELVLIYEASWEVQHGINVAFSKSASDKRHMVQTVTRADLPNYLDQTVLPRELGGYNTAIVASDAFADAVLRHWYLNTSYLLLEDANTRPLWQLPPSISTVNEWNALQTRNVGNRDLFCIVSPSAYPALAPGGAASGRCSPAIPLPYSSRSPSAMLDAASFVSSRSHAFRANPDDDDDDGFCSALSDQDDYGRTAGSCRLTPNEIHLDVAANGNTVSSALLSRELQRERELRMNAEQQLKKVRLGVTLDLATATELERTLALMHAEVNILVANIAARARESAASGSPPTLVQLLDLTLSALEAAANRTEHVPAMRFAVPVRQGPSQSSSCCELM